MEDNDQEPHANALGQEPHANALGQEPPNDRHKYLVEELMEVAARIKENSQIECSFEIWLILITMAFEVLFKSRRNIFIRVIGFLTFVAFSFIFPLAVIFILIHNMFVDIRAFLFGLVDFN